MAKKIWIEVLVSDKAAKSLDKIGGKIGGLAGIAAKASAITVASLTAISAAVLKLASDSLEFKGIRDAFNVLTADIEGGSQRMLAALRAGSAGFISNREVMQKFNEAATMVSRDFAQTLPNAMEYMTKISAATGKKMDYLLGSYVTGVSKLSRVVLDNLGIQVSLEEATARAAKTFGVAASALSQEQKQAGMAAVALEKLGIMTAGLPDAPPTIAKLSATLMNIKDSVGLFFVPAFNKVLSVLDKLTAKFYDAIQEGGSLYPTMIKLGAAASLMADAFGLLVDNLVPVGKALYNNVAKPITSFAGRALVWGTNIVIQLANGIIRGASTVLVTALNFVGGILKKWLGPGSPPRIAPDLDKWGVSAMNEYLIGFTHASFDILEGVQRPLQNIFSALVTSGKMAATDAAAAFRDIGAELAYSVSEFQATGNVSESLFQRLSAVGGGFGESLAEVARRQFAVAAATDKVRQASERLLAAQTSQEGAQTDLARITEEYNMMLLEGASHEELLAKYAEKTSAEKRATASKAAVKSAEDEKKAAEAQIGVEKERLQLQIRLIDQLQLLAQAQTDMIAASVTGAAGVPSVLEGIMPEIEPLGVSGAIEPIVDSLSVAIDEAKQRIKTKLATMFPGLAEIYTTWRDEGWDAAFALIKADISKWIDDTFGVGTSEKVTEFAGDVSTSLTRVKTAFDECGIGGAITVLGEEIVKGLTKYFGEETANMITEWFIPALTGLGAVILAVVIPAFVAWLAPIIAVTAPLIAFGLAITLAAHAIQEAGGLSEVLSNLGELFTIVADIIRMKVWLAVDKMRLGFLNMKRDVIDLKDAALEPLKKAWDQITTALVGPATSAIDGIKILIGELRDLVQGGIDRFNDFKTTMANIQLPGWIQAVIDKLKTLGGLLAPFLGHSPSPLELGFTGIGEAVSKLAQLQLPKLSVGFAGLAPASVETPMSAGGQSSSSSSSHLYIEQLILEGVQDPQNLLTQLQELSI